MFNAEAATLQSQLTAARERAAEMDRDLKASEALLRAKDKEWRAALAEVERYKDASGRVGAIESRLKGAERDAGAGASTAKKMEALVRAKQGEIDKLLRDVLDLEGRERKATNRGVVRPSPSSCDAHLY